MSDCNSISLDSLNRLSELMMEQYNKGQESVLDEEEQTTLNNVAEYFSNYCKEESIEFNENGFKNFVIKLYPKNSTQFGGYGEDTIVPYNQPKTNTRAQFIVSDFYAILAFLSSIFMIYLAYIKLNQIIINTSGMGLNELSEQIKNDITSAIDAVNNMQSNDLTFLQFVYRSISTFSCSIVDSQMLNAQLFVITAIESSFINARRLLITNAQQVCGLKTQVLSEDWGVLGKIINTASAVATTYTSRDSVSDCVNQVTQETISKIYDDQKHIVSMLTLQFSTQSKQISDLLTIAVRIGVPSALYLLNRLKDFFPKIREIPNFEDLPRVNSGGRKTKKTRKNKRKTRKIRINKK